MKHNLAYWRWVYRTSRWHGVRWCLNCWLGPQAWRRIARNWWMDFRMKRRIRRMTPEQRAEMIAMLKQFDQPALTTKGDGLSG